MNLSIYMWMYDGTNGFKDTVYLVSSNYVMFMALY